MGMLFPTSGALAVAFLAVGATAATMSTPPLPSASAYETVAYTEMTVSNSYGYANLRQGPSASSKLLDKLPQGTKVIVIKKVSGGLWVHVKVGLKEGYIQTKLLK